MALQESSKNFVIEKLSDLIKVVFLNLNQINDNEIQISALIVEIMQTVVYGDEEPILDEIYFKIDKIPSSNIKQAFRAFVKNIYDFLW